MDTLNQMLSQLNKQDIIMLTFGKAVGDIQKAKIRPVQDAFQLEKIIDNKAFHENMDFEQLKDNVYMLLDKYFMQAVIYTKSDDIHIFKNRKAELSIKKHKATKIKRDSAHDRKKLRIIEDGVQAPFLIDLGICDKEGRVLDKNSKKFIQINAFLHILDNAVSKLNFNNRKVKIVDYCCGKAYLTFAVHYYFQNIKKIPFSILGIDLKEDVISKLNEIVVENKMQDISFIHGDISAYNQEVDIAIGLHACDIATDIFLSSAAKNEAKLIISVPCCQHQLNKQIKNDKLDSILSFGLQKDKCTEIITNTLRALALRSVGYNVDMVEFTAIEHTMKNVLIRAVRTGRVDKKAKTEYDELIDTFDITDFEGNSILKNS